MSGVKSPSSMRAATGSGLPSIASIGTCSNAPVWSSQTTAPPVPPPTAPRGSPQPRNPSPAESTTRSVTVPSAVSIARSRIPCPSPSSGWTRSVRTIVPSMQGWSPVRPSRIPGSMGASSCSALPSRTVQRCPSSSLESDPVSTAVVPPQTADATGLPSISARVVTPVSPISTTSVPFPPARTTVVESSRPSRWPPPPSPKLPSRSVTGSVPYRVMIRPLRSTRLSPCTSSSASSLPRSKRSSEPSGRTVSREYSDPPSALSTAEPISAAVYSDRSRSSGARSPPSAHPPSTAVDIAAVARAIVRRRDMMAPR